MLVGGSFAVCHAHISPVGRSSMSNFDCNQNHLYIIIAMQRGAMNRRAAQTKMGNKNRYSLVHSTSFYMRYIIKIDQCCAFRIHSLNMLFAAFLFFHRTKRAVYSFVAYFKAFETCNDNRTACASRALTHHMKGSLIFAHVCVIVSIVNASKYYTQSVCVHR